MTISDPIVPLDFCWNSTDVLMIVLVPSILAILFLHDWLVARNARVRQAPEAPPPKREKSDPGPVTDGRYR